MSMLQIQVYFKYNVVLNFVLIKESWKKNHDFHKHIKQQININIYNNHTTISILDRFLKDHVTPKTGVLAAEILYT